jgi:tRNA pseudouridine55 synthase
MADNDRPAPPTDGILVVDKPAGPTSHDVVDRVRRAIGVRRIGHTGTLDPFATGVLPLVVGRATRLAQFLTATDKAYDATIRLGIATDTYDITGRLAGAAAGEPEAVRAPGAALPDRAAVEQALAAFVGTYSQAPPPFSAKKIDGVRAYVRARQGMPVDPKPVVVSAYELALESAEAGVIRVRIRCSAGFYVRALAHALGERLGIGAHLEALRRTGSGGFDIGQAIALECLEREGPAAARRLLPLSGALPHLPAVTLTESGVRHAIHGMALSGNDFLAPAAPSWAAPGPVRLVGPDGRLVAIAKRSGAADVLHPFVVIG